MPWLRDLIARRRNFQDLSEEIQQHLQEQAEALMSRGMSRDQAERTARRSFGNVTRIEESGREAWTWPRLEQLFTDLRFAMRRLRRSPGFTLTAVITLALGIGANVFVFSLLNGLILRPLAVPEPANLFQVSRGKNGGDSQSYRDYLDFRDHDASFRGMLAYKTLRAGLDVGKSPVRSWGYAVSGNYFDVLGVQPALGHFFHAKDDRGLGSAPYMVLSDDLWRRQFGSDPRVIGQTVQLNHQPFNIIAVAPRDFRGTDVFFWPDYWIPVMNTEPVTGWDDLCCRDHLGFTILGRLKSGATASQATQSLNALALQMAKADPKDDGLTLRVRLPGAAGDSDDPMRKALAGLMLLSALVLLAACANLASIFAAQASDRSSELATRLAIGSGRWTIVRQLLTEALLVSTLGGVLGSAFARVLLGALSHWQPFGEYPTRLLVTPDARVYLIAFGLSLVSGIVFGLMPARQVWRTDVVQAIKSGYVLSESFRRFTFRDLLLVIQIVVCTLLVTASLVSVLGMARALHVPLGFDPAGVTLAQADLRMAGYTSKDALPAQKRLLDAAQAIPGVTAAAVSDSVPFRSGGDWFVYRWGTTEFLPSHMAFAATTFAVSPGYLRASGTELLAGRDFTWHDDSKSPKVAIVNQTFARMLYGDKPAIGQRFALWATAKYEIVGVVADGRYNALDEEPQPTMLLGLAQGMDGGIATSSTILVRSRLPQNQIASALAHRLADLEPSLPLTVLSWDDAVDLSLTPSRAIATVLGIMGLLAAMLAVTGIFGMASYAVSKRRKEQGIRIAMGAQRAQVLVAMLRRPVLLLLYGSAAGIVAGLLTSHLMAHLIAFATPRDPFVLLGVLLTMTALGAVATWIPARRALAVDPSRLLRE